MKQLNPLLQLTPEIYFLLFSLLWVSGNYMDMLGAYIPTQANFLPLILVSFFTIQLLWRQRLLGVLIVLILSLGSFYLALNNFSILSSQAELDAQLISMFVFGMLVFLTNLTMVFCLLRKYKLLQLEE